MPVTLTQLQQRIAALATLPDDERRAAAAAVLALADQVLTPAIADATAIGAWIRIARAIDPRVAAQSTPERARETARRIVLGGDPLAAVHAAAAADAAARTSADQARAALVAAAVQAVRAGLQPAAVAPAAGVSRQNLYGWLSGS